MTAVWGKKNMKVGKNAFLLLSGGSGVTAQWRAAREGRDGFLKLSVLLQWFVSAFSLLNQTSTSRGLQSTWDVSCFFQGKPLLATVVSVCTPSSSNTVNLLGSCPSPSPQINHFVFSLLVHFGLYQWEALSRLNWTRAADLTWWASLLYCNTRGDGAQCQGPITGSRDSVHV